MRARLGREQEVLSYIDLIVYNWRLRDPALTEPMVVENLELLFPTVGNDRSVTLDVSENPVRYQPGDRCHIGLIALPRVAQAHDPGERAHGPIRPQHRRVYSISSCCP